jgi:hypothetical protein
MDINVLQLRVLTKISKISKVYKGEINWGLNIVTAL